MRPSAGIDRACPHSSPRRPRPPYTPPSSASSAARMPGEFEVSDAFSCPSSSTGHPHSGAKEKHRVKIYVGNLSFNTTEAQMREMFEKHGAVSSADRKSV